MSGEKAGYPANLISGPYLPFREGGGGGVKELEESVTLPQLAQRSLHNIIELIQKKRNRGKLTETGNRNRNRNAFPIK